MAAQLLVEIKPVEIGGQHWVSVHMDGHLMTRRGPFPNADIAGGVADQLIRQWRNRTADPP